MSRTVAQGFECFHDTLKTSPAETEAAKSHRRSINDCLKSNFGLERFVRIGSFGNGTNIKDYSDVDYLAHLPSNVITNTSTALLTKVKDVLTTRFPNTGVKISTPAVVCPFGRLKSEDTEVVVAEYVKDKNGFKVYHIADGSGGWMEVSPDAHNSYVAEIDMQHGGKVKPLIRFIKAWKCFCNVPINSFYLEMRVAAYAKNERTIIYSVDIKAILELLIKSKLALMHDPMGVSGYIYPCKTDAFKQDALSKLETATIRAEKARDAETRNNIEKAFENWNLLYNNGFSSYY